MKHIFHPTDLTTDGEVAFLHALRLAVAARGNLTVMHVSPADTDFERSLPKARRTLAAWGLLADGADTQGLRALGVGVKKVMAEGPDPVEACLNHLERHPSDLVVLATHQRGGRMVWGPRPVAEPLARGAGGATLLFHAPLQVPPDRIDACRQQWPPPRVDELRGDLYAVLVRFARGLRAQGIDLLVLLSPYPSGPGKLELERALTLHLHRLHAILDPPGYLQVDGRACRARAISTAMRATSTATVLAASPIRHWRFRMCSPRTERSAGERNCAPGFTLRVPLHHVHPRSATVAPVRGLGSWLGPAARDRRSMQRRGP